jgi:hypothetical protein
VITPRAFAITSSLVLALVAACSGSQGGFTQDGGAPAADTGVSVLGDTGTATGDTGTYIPPADTGTGTPTGDTGTISVDGPTGTGQCTPNCKTDSDCQSSCPAVAGALNCCDTSSGVCFTSSEAMCPDQSGTEGGTAPTEGGAY